MLRTNHAREFERSTELEDDARRDERVSRVLEFILTAPDFEPSAVRPLADRWDYPFAARLLRAKLPRRKNLMQTMVAPPADGILAVRIASMLGALTYREADEVLPTRADVERIAAHDSDKGGLARVALCLAGLPIVPWPQASLPERAAVTLRELIKAMRDGGGP